MQNLSSHIQNLTSDINKFFLDFINEIFTNRYYLVLLGVLGFSAYGILAFNPIFVGDHWTQIFKNEAYGVFASGRWMMGIFWNLYFDNLFTPTVTTITSYIAISLSCNSIAKNLGISSKFEKFIFTSLVVLCPILTPHFAMYTHQLPFAFAFTLLAKNTFWLKKALDFPQENNFKYYFYVAISQAVILGIRQEFFFLGLNLLFASCLFNTSREDHSFKSNLNHLYKALFSSVASVPIYYLIWKFTVYYYHATIFDSGYYSVEENLGKIFTSLLTTVPRAFYSIYYFNFFETPHWPVVSKYIFISISIFTLALIGLKFLARADQQKSKLLKDILVNYTLYFLVILSPWGVVLTVPNMTEITHTALLGLAPTYAILICYSLSITTNKSLILIFRSLTLFIIIVFTIFQNYAFTSIHLRNTREFFIGSKILASIENHVESEQFIESTPQIVIFLGKIHQKDSEKPLYHAQNHPLGWSLINDEVTEEYIFRIRELFKLIDTKTSNQTRKYYAYSPESPIKTTEEGEVIINFFGGLSSTEKEDFLSKLDNAPLWQSKRSILFNKNFVFVKLSENKNIKYSESIRKLID